MSILISCFAFTNNNHSLLISYPKVYEIGQRDLMKNRKFEMKDEAIMKFSKKII